MTVSSIVLSAGKGTRMQSELPKVIQKVCDYEMVNMVLKSLSDAGINKNYLVVGYKKDEVINSIDPVYDFDHIEQKEQLGTGHAVKIAYDKLHKIDGITIVTCGDTPLITSNSFKALIEHHKSTKSDLTVMTAKVNNPFGYGRIVRDDNDLVSSIVEQKDANEEVLLINEINAGVYCFDNKKLFNYINSIDNNNSQNEYYLTDLVKIFNQSDERVSAYVINDATEILGVNDLKALSDASNILKTRINNNLLLNGVNIVDINNTYISPVAKIASGTIIEPGCTIKGYSVIGNACHILANSYIDNSTIKNNTSFGPQAHARMNTLIGSNCRVGNYVELKNVVLGDDTKVAHLTYLGDATLGNNVNVGCGVITANYDGVTKSKTVIGNDVFIGSNSNLIAPCTIGDRAFIAAGTTVTRDLDVETFAIDRNDLRLKTRRYDVKN